MLRIAVKPDIYRWAQERAGLTSEEIAAKFKKFPEWESGEEHPTLKQLEGFARHVRAPVGYFFLDEPPEEEKMPIADFRSRGGGGYSLSPSPDLLAMLYLCEARQDWYRDYAQEDEEPALDFIGAATTKTSPADAAAEMREILRFDVAARRECETLESALRLLIRRADEAGILVMVSGVVRSDNTRRLNVAEFRGFALSDPHAPLIFVNGADAKAAQIFTVAHELAHLWLGKSALSDGDASPDLRVRREEKWCNAVAAEFLVPLADLRAELRRDESPLRAKARLARLFKVSELVILRRLLDAKRISREEFNGAWAREMKRLRDYKASKSGGGDFYRATLARVGHRFARAIIASAIGGGTLYRDAYRMLSISKTRTFQELAKKVGVAK